MKKLCCFSRYMKTTRHARNCNMLLFLLLLWYILVDLSFVSNIYTVRTVECVNIHVEWMNIHGIMTRHDSCINYIANFIRWTYDSNWDNLSNFCVKYWISTLWTNHAGTATPPLSLLRIFVSFCVSINRIKVSILVLHKYVRIVVAT